MNIIILHYGQIPNDPLDHTVLRLQLHIKKNNKLLNLNKQVCGAALRKCDYDTKEKYEEHTKFPRKKI